MKKQIVLKKPETKGTRSLKSVSIYEELMGTHEARTTSSCKSKCPTKCSSCG